MNSQGGWEDLLSLFGLPDSTANGALSIKQIYQRFLDSYEKTHFLGDGDDDDDNQYYDEEDSR